MSARFTIIDPTPPTIDPRITHDAKTWLDWQTVCFNRHMSWADADKACKTLRLRGYDDWRMPTIEELESIRDRGRHSPAIAPDSFPECPSSWFWSSTPAAESPSSYVWVVHFGYGNSSIGIRDGDYCVRAVRGPVVAQGDQQ